MLSWLAIWRCLVKHAAQWSGLTNRCIFNRRAEFIQQLSLCSMPRSKSILINKFWLTPLRKFFIRNQRLLFSIRRRQFDLRSSYGSRQLTHRRLIQIFASFQNAGIRPLQLRNWKWSLRISSAWVNIRLSQSDW